MSAVVLPGIREMFPEYLNEEHAHPHTTKKDRAKSSRSSTLRGPKTYNPPNALAIPTSRQHSSPRTGFSSLSHGPFPDERQSSNSSPSYPTQNATGSTSFMPNLDPHTTKMRSKSGSMFYSFDILKSDPSSPSLQHIASSATYGNRALYHNGQNIRSISSDGSTPTFRIAVTASSDTTQDSTIPDSRGYTTSDNRVDKQPGSQSGSGCLSFPVFGSAPVRRNQCGEVSDSDDEDLSASNSGKRHICSICLKRFNRPSSLKIHVNTHTGVTPFRCPWPNCGREFNVNSNMRRHYRNHTMPGSKAVELRRRRRGVPPSSLVDFDASSSHTSHLTPISSMNSPSLSGRSDSEDSDEELPTPMDECDEIRSGADGASGISKNTTYQASRYYSQSHIRTLRYDSASRSPSPSSSSRSPDHVYTPSAPYIQSFMDPRVSTALRPVFHPAFPVPSAADTKERR